MIHARNNQYDFFEEGSFTSSKAAFSFAVYPKMTKPSFMTILYICVYSGCSSL